MNFYGFFFYERKNELWKDLHNVEWLLFCQTFYKITPPPLSIAILGVLGVSSVLSLVGDHEGKPCHEEEYTYI